MSTKGLIRKIAILAAAFLAGAALYAQTDGTYSGYTPYSIYGVGNLHPGGTAFHQGMGGGGVALRNRRFVNTLNPASVTARDSLSFMADFGLSGKNTIYRQNDFKSAHNTFNINDFVISFPIWGRKIGMMAGILPFSSVGYNFSYTETRPDLVGIVGNNGYTSSGKGSLNEAFVALGGTLWKRFSVGAQFNYYFGNLSKSNNLIFANDAYRDIYSGYDLKLKGVTGKFGIQYEQPLGDKFYLTLGATYRMRTRLGGYATDYSYAVLSSQTDTLKNHIDTLAHSRSVSLGDELAVGISLRRGEDWTIQMDYTRSGWGKSGFDQARGFAGTGASRFSATTAQSLRAGFEWTPNRSDIRYFYRRFTYRAGAYYEQAYYKLNGQNVTGFGLTFGLTIPVFRDYGGMSMGGYNGVTVGLDLGQRGRLDNNLIRERYVGINVGVNIFDLWFHKRQYD